MPRGISKLNSLYATLRSDDADCLDLASVIEILKDVDKRIARAIPTEPSSDHPLKSPRKPPPNRR